MSIYKYTIMYKLSIVSRKYPIVTRFNPLEHMRPIYRKAYKLPLASSVLHLGQPQPQPFNPLIPNELRRRRAVRPLQIKIPSKNLGRQRCTEGFNFVAKRLIFKNSTWCSHYVQRFVRISATATFALYII